MSFFIFLRIHIPERDTGSSIPKRNTSSNRESRHGFESLRQGHGFEPKMGSHPERGTVVIEGSGPIIRFFFSNPEGLGSCQWGTGSYRGARVQSQRVRVRILTRGTHSGSIPTEGHGSKRNTKEDTGSNHPRKRGTGSNQEGPTRSSSHPNK